MKALNKVECKNISAAQGADFFIEIDELTKGRKHVSELTEEDLTRLKALNFQCDPHTATIFPWCNPIK